MFTSNIRHDMNKLIRILILEDSATDAVLMEDELREAVIPFRSKRVFKEEDFVRELQDFSPDLILSDYDLPQYNGALALAKVKSQYSHTPFILVTGAIDECLAKEIIIKGADDFVMKSQLHKLAPAVRKVMKKAAS
jgi:PleD family two-component response regulator